MSGSNILVVVSGSIAAYKACDAISQLVQLGHRVRVVATAAALQFVGRATLEGLTGQRVLTDLFDSGAALEHIAVTRWADLTLVCPATAALLNRMAAGLADDLAGSVLLAHDRSKPLLLAPAMNPAMWTHPATVAAVARLGEWGARFVAIGVGRTACGERGEGRLAEPAEIVAAVNALLARPAGPRRRILVTSGGTSEPIDGVRVLSNRSTGETGAGIADYFARQGHEVTLLRATSAVRASAGVREVVFDSFADLDAALQRELSGTSFDAVVHAAAVSDYAVDAIEVNGIAQPPGSGKLRSDVAPVLRLRTNPKLIATLRARSANPHVRIVGFKLTRGVSAEAARDAVETLFADGTSDFVVHNDLAARGADGVFPATVWRRGGGIVERCADRGDIAPALLRQLFPPTRVTFGGRGDGAAGVGEGRGADAERER